MLRLRGKTSANLYYDKKRRVIGIAPWTRKRKGAAKIRQSDKSTSLHVPSFFRFYDIDVPGIKRFHCWYDEKERMAMIDISSRRRAAGRRDIRAKSVTLYGFLVPAGSSTRFRKFAHETPEAFRKDSRWLSAKRDTTGTSASVNAPWRGASRTLTDPPLLGSNCCRSHTGGVALRGSTTGYPHQPLRAVADLPNKYLACRAS